MSMMTKLDNAIARNGAAHFPARLSIGVDIDDVISPWYDPAHDACVAAGIAGADRPETWYPYREYPNCTKEAWLEVLANATINGPLYTLPPFEGAVEALRRLYWEGHYIHLVTARSTGDWPHGDRLREITREWVAEFAVPHHTLTFSHDKTVIPCDFFIEDNITNYDALDNMGVEVYLLNQRHNQHTRPDIRRRVDSVTEFVDIILQEAS